MTRKSLFRIVIQSRLSSSRLPAKALLPIAGIPSVVLCALRAANKGAEVVVATSTEPSDDLLADALLRAGILCFRGPLSDVMGRFVLATADLPPQATIVRLTADNVFPDGEFVQEVALELQKKGLEYLGTSSPLDKLPYGLAAEAFTVEALREANQKATLPYDREHVTPWMTRNTKARVFTPEGWQGNLGHLRCTMDNLEDYLRLNRVFKDIKDPVAASWALLSQILSRLPGEPSVRAPYRLKNGVIHSELALGTVQLGMEYGVTSKGKPSVEQARAIVRRALAHGIICIDTARVYGDSEKIIGQSLTGGYGQQVNVITKLDPLRFLDGSESEKNLRLAVDASIFRSCKELQTQQLQTVLIHRWQHRLAFKESIWRRLLELKAEGVIKTLGASVETPQEAREALEDPEVFHIQLPFNILDWRWKAARIDELALGRQDVIIHARSTLLQGILPAAPPIWSKIETKNPSHWIEKIALLTKELNRESSADLCFAYVRAQQWVTSCLVGVENITQLDENIKLFQKPPLELGGCQFVEETLRGAPEQLLNPVKWPL